MRRKRLLLFIVPYVLLCAPIVVSVEAASMWSQTYGGTENECVYTLVETSDGGYVLAGYTTSWGAGGRDIWLAKTDSNGVMEWNRVYGGTGDDEAYSLVATSDGGYAIAGAWNYSSLWEFNDYAGGDFWLIKTNAFGDMDWERKYGGTGSDIAYSLVATSDGGYAIAGAWNYSSDYGFRYTGDFWLVKTDALGNMEWNQTYVSGKVESLVATSDGGYAIAGYTLPFGNSLLVKTDAFGNMQWNQTYGNTEAVLTAKSMVETLEGGYAIAGFATFFDSGEGTYSWLAKTDAFGNMQWNQTYVEVDIDTSVALATATDGAYALASTINIFGGGGATIWLIKTNSNGAMEWNQTYGGPAADFAYSLVAAADGGYAIAGYTTSFGAGGQDFYLVKTDEFGVVPEYTSWLVPALVLTATAFIIIKNRKKGKE